MNHTAKSGRVLSAANYEALKTARDLIAAILELNKQQKLAAKHLPGAHDQATHAHGGHTARPGMGDTVITDQNVAEFAGGSAEQYLVKNADGSWGFTAERQALHDQIVNDALAGVPVSENPTYHVMGGGPAAGKSTMIERGGADVPTGKQAVQVNPDDVKTHIPEYNAMRGDPAAASFAHEESSYVAKRIQAAAFERGHDVVLDGTGDSSEKSINGKISTARAAGYRVVGNYATVPTDVAVERANARGAKTGRYVPESVIRGTHSAVSQIFPKIAGNFDEVKLWDTMGTPKIIASGGKGKLTVHDQDAYNAFLAKGDG